MPHTNPEGLGEPPRPDPCHTLVISGTCTYKPILQSRIWDRGLSGPTLPAWFLPSSSFINKRTFECIVCSELQITKLQVRRGAVRPLYLTDRMQALRSYRTECSVQAGHQGGLPGGEGWGLEGKRDTSQAYSRLCFQTGPGREPEILGSWESYEWWGWRWGWGKGGGGGRVGVGWEVGVPSPHTGRVSWRYFSILDGLTVFPLFQRWGRPAHLYTKSLIFFFFSVLVLAPVLKYCVYRLKFLLPERNK